MADQPVAATDQSSQTAGNESKGAPDDELSRLLAEVPDDTPAKSAPKPDSQAKTPKASDEVAQTLDDVRQFMRQQQERDFDRGVAEAVKIVKGDTNVRDKVARAWLEAEAQEDSRLLTAFRQRDRHPKRWESILKAKAGEFAKEFPSHDPAATKDREALAASVRGSTKSRKDEDDQMTPQEAAAMSSDEYHAWKRKHGWAPY